LDTTTGVISGAPSATAASATYTVTATNAGGSTTATFIVAVGKATPTISAAPAASDITFGQTLANSTLTGGTASTAGTFAFTTPSTSPNVGTANQDVTFTPNDTANYNTATASVSVTVGKATPTISAAPAASDITFGQTLANSTLTGGTASTAGTFAFTTPSTSPNVGTADQGVTFTPNDTANYNTATASVSVTVTSSAPTGLSYTSSSINGTVGAEIVSLTPTVTGSGITYSIDPALPSGLLLSPTTGVISGTPLVASASAAYTVTATNAGGSTTAMLTVAVAKIDQTITFGSLPAVTYAGGATLNLMATASSGLEVSYASSDTTVATVSGSTVTIVGAGSAIITASQAGSANYNPATSVDQTLTVNKADHAITFGSLADVTYSVGATLNLMATASSGLDVSYVSSDTTVATVSGNIVTILKAGSTEITASQAGGDNYNAAPAVTRTLTVNNADQTITFNPLSAVAYGAASLNLTAIASSGLEVSYVSSDTTVATVSGNVVTILKAGATEITASQAGNSSYAAATSVPQTLTVLRRPIMVTADAKSMTYGDANPALTFVVSDLVGSDTLSGSLATTATTSSSVSGSPYGITQGTVNNASNPNYDISFRGADLSVSAKAITVTADAQTKVYGALDPALTYQVASGALVGSDVLSGSLSRVAGEDVGTYAISSTLANANYDVTFVPNNLAIGQADATVTWPTAAAITYGDALSSATLTGGSREGTFAFTSPLTVPSAGVAQSFEVTFTPSSANYKTATQMVSVMVNKATPLITAVPTASAISFGQTLASSVLSNGTASVDGSFAFTTTSTAPSAGTASQGVTFTPNNTANYNTASTTVSVTVNPASLSSSDITLVPAGDGSYTATAAGVSGFTYSYAGRNQTSYGPSATAPTVAGFYTVTATSADGNYLGSASVNFSVTGPVAAGDALTKSGSNQPLLIPISDLLANDFRITNTSGATATGGLTVSAVTSGSGNTATLAGAYIQFTPSSGSTDTFTYTVSDGAKTGMGTVTITTETQAPTFTLQIVKVGTATYSGGNTTVTHDFIGVPGQVYQLEYTTNISGGAYTIIGNQSTGATGSFSVMITKSGDFVSEWNTHMFFRARLVR